jgi:glycyl-tRNA synthetase alpha subunit
MARYRVDIHATVEIEIADAILALSQDAQWVHDFYRLDTPELVAEHLAWNVGLQGCDLSRLDGFADRQDSDVRAIVVDVDYDTERITGALGAGADRGRG